MSNQSDSYDHERNMKGLDKTYANAREVVAKWSESKRARLSAYLRTPDTNLSNRTDASSRH